MDGAPNVSRRQRLPNEGRENEPLRVARRLHRESIPGKREQRLPPNTHPTNQVLTSVAAIRTAAATAGVSLSGLHDSPQYQLGYNGHFKMEKTGPIR